jgi:integrase
MFNPDIKNRFMEHYEDNSINSFSRVFELVSPSERQINKDIFDMNRDELKSVLFTLNPLKVNSSKFYGSTLRAYIDWAISEGYRRNTINPLNGIDGEWFEQFIDKSKKTVYHKSEIEQLIQACANDQDVAIIRAIFEGVSPDELLLLSMSDINVNTRMLTLKDNQDNKRQHRVSLECIENLVAANRQVEYYKSNGNAPSTTKNKTTELIDNGYIIKISSTGRDIETGYNNNIGGAQIHVIYRRFKTLQNEMKQYAYITPINIRNSGMLYKAYTLYLRDGELKAKQLDEICFLFNVRKNKRNLYNRSSLTGDFLNEKTLFEIYEDLIKP